MRRYLVIQLARFGDLLQSKRLMLSLERELASAPFAPGELHLALDQSLLPLAKIIYPFAVLHPLKAHAGSGGPADNLDAFARLSGLDFARIYNLNYSGLSLALSRLFEPEKVLGYREFSGQRLVDPWCGLAFRMLKRRRLSCLNLADFWAGLSGMMLESSQVNPLAQPGGRGLGVVLAGRESRRSLPATVLAGLVQAAYSKISGGKIYLFGTKSEQGFAKELKLNLKSSLAEKVEDLSGKTDYPGLLEAMRGLDRLLTPDTGSMHLAAHLGVPVTAFFLSSAWCHETGPYGLGHTVWQAVSDCAPCLESAPCVHDMQCLKPFAGPGFLRAFTLNRSEGLSGLRLYASALDELGACFEVCGEADPEAGFRARLRTYLAKRLSLGSAGPDPELAGELDREPDWMLFWPPAGQYSALA